MSWDAERNTMEQVKYRLEEKLEPTESVLDMEEQELTFWGVSEEKLEEYRSLIEDEPGVLLSVADDADGGVIVTASW